MFFLLKGFSQTKYIHVIVSLYDNKNQGIVKVSKTIGNGQDPANNLYWGCAYGVRVFFKKQNEWKLIKQINNPKTQIYERLIFKHRDSSIYLVADAYDGAKIKDATIDLLNYAAGKETVNIEFDSIKMNVGANSDLICYVGHNGLMDFSLESYPTKSDNKKREVVILACASRNYFYYHIKKTGAYPLLWTSNLMCPEAYTLDAVIDSWIKRESNETIRDKAAQTYSDYQKCGFAASKNLLRTGY